MKYIAILTAFSTFSPMGAFGVEDPHTPKPSSHCSCIGKACCAVSGLTALLAAPLVFYNFNRSFQLEYNHPAISGFVFDEESSFPTISYLVYDDDSLLCKSGNGEGELGKKYTIPEDGCTVYIEDTNYKTVLLPAKKFNTSCCFTQYTNPIVDPRKNDIIKRFNSFFCSHSGAQPFATPCNKSSFDYTPLWSQKCLLKSETSINPELGDPALYTCEEIIYGIDPEDTKYHVINDEIDF